jgi:hypothetical protein
MRTPSTIATLALLGACARQPVATVAATTPGPVAPTARVTPGPGFAASALPVGGPDVPAPPSALTSGSAMEDVFGPAGPIVIRGYPVDVGSGFAAVAVRGGFTPDGDELGVCYFDGGAENAHCKLVGRSGRARGFDVRAKDDGFSLDLRSPAGKQAAGLAPLMHRGDAAYDFWGPPLRGHWPFARDIVLHVAQVAGKKNGLAFPKLRVGGSVRGRAAVYPLEIQRPLQREVNDVHFIRPNVIALSPDGSELGIVVHSATMEYDATYTFHRVDVKAFVAHIYALSAKAARDANAQVDAKDLCALAVAADPRVAGCEP